MNKKRIETRWKRRHEKQKLQKQAEDELDDIKESCALKKPILTYSKK